MPASDGISIEMFEWRKGAIGIAPGDPPIRELWARNAKLSDYILLKDLQETSELFGGFKPVTNTVPISS